MRRLLPILACALALAACGQPKDDGVATAGGPQSENQQQVSSDPKERVRQFAQCMRDNGVEMDDPEIVEDGSGGEGFKMRVEAGPPGEAAKEMPQPDKEKFQKAREACQQYLPDGGELGEMDPEAEEKAREYAKCMRENGVENFPDPSAAGGIHIGPESGIDPRDPAFQEAQKKCAGSLPGFKSESKVS